MKTQPDSQDVYGMVPRKGAAFKAVLEDKIAIDPKIERAYDNCDKWLRAAYAKLVREGVEV